MFIAVIDEHRVRRKTFKKNSTVITVFLISNGHKSSKSFIKTFTSTSIG